MESIYLVGFMGAGKSTIGAHLAHHYGLKFIDLDQEIQKRTQQSITHIFETKGEAYFRNLEYHTLISLPKTSYVIALGGGSIEHQQIRTFLIHKPYVIYLSASFACLYQRIMAQNSNHRPLVQSNNKHQLYQKYKDRLFYYETVANMIYKQSCLETPEEVCQQIIKKIELS